MPCYGIYKAADGKYLTVAAIEPHFWVALCKRLDRPELAEKHMAQDPAVRQAVREELEAAFAKREASAWLEYFDHSEIPVGRVNRFEEAMSDPQMQHREMVLDDVTPPRLGFPAASTGAVPEPTGPPPDLGEHTDEILARLGFKEADREELRKAGVIEP